MNDTARDADVVEPEVLTPEADEASKEEEKASTAITRSIPGSLVDLLAHQEDAVKVIARRAEMLTSIRMAAISQTNPAQWTLMKGRDGEAIALPGSGACNTIGDLYGIEVYDVRPRNDARGFEPKTEESNGVTTYRGWASARSVITGSVVELIEASRSSNEDFIGRSSVPGDIRLAVQTLLRSKAVRIIAGLGRLPVSVLEKAWAGDATKDIKNCQGGSGYGKAADRAAATVSDDDTKTAAKDLGSEMLNRCQGDVDAAKALLVDCTKSLPGKKEFAGFDSVARFTQSWQVEAAWKRLRDHDQYGDKALGIPKDGKAKS